MQRKYRDCTWEPRSSDDISSPRAWGLVRSLCNGVTSIEVLLTPATSRRRSAPLLRRILVAVLAQHQGTCGRSYPRIGRFTAFLVDEARRVLSALLPRSPAST